MQQNELETLIQKSKLNKTQTKQASEILLTYFQEDNLTLLCDYLFKLPLGVTSTFFSENYSTLVVNDGLTRIIKQLELHELFNKNTRDCSVLRCFEIINECFANDNYSSIVESLFAKTLNFTVKNNLFKASFFNHFNKKITHKTDILKLNIKEENKLLFFLFIVQLSNEEFTNSNEFINCAVYDEFVAKKDELNEIILNANTKPSKAYEKGLVTALTKQVEEQAQTLDKLNDEVELLKKLLEDEKKKTQDLVENLELSFGIGN